MLKQFKKIIKNQFYLLLLMIVIFLISLFFIVKIQLKPSEIDLKDFKIDEEIVFEIISTYENEEYIYFEGYAYRLSDLIEFDNYITGNGSNYRINNNLFIKMENSVIEIYTSPKHIPNIYNKNELNIGYAGFISKVSKSEINTNINYQIGVIVHQNNDNYYKLAEALYKND